MPELMPETRPVLLIVATEAALLLQVPPLMLAVRVAVVPVHNSVTPDITAVAGVGFTSTITVAADAQAPDKTV